MNKSCEIEIRNMDCLDVKGIYDILKRLTILFGHKLKPYLYLCIARLLHDHRSTSSDSKECLVHMAVVPSSSRHYRRYLFSVERIDRMQNSWSQVMEHNQRIGTRKNYMHLRLHMLDDYHC